MNESGSAGNIETVDVVVELTARDQIKLRLEHNGGEIVRSQLTAIGCLELLRLVASWRLKLSGQLSLVPLPLGVSHGAILLREVILKAQGLWSFPYAEDELCHCRAVPTEIVDAAIVGGCHTVESIKSATSASTSCGTCRPDVEKVIAYRLGS